MKREAILYGIIILFLISFISATTTISDNVISTTGTLDIGNSSNGDKFVLSNGNFGHKPGHFEEVFCLRDDESGGTAQYLNRTKDVFVQGKYAYVISLGDNALSVIDISDPTNLSEISGISDDSVGGNATGLEDPTSIFVSGNYAYVLGRAEPALSIIDVSDPSNLTEVGVLFGNASTHLETPLVIQVAGGYAYVASRMNNSLTVIDVSDPTNPQEVGVIVADSGSGIYLQEPFAMTLSGNYIYFISHYTYILSVLDISNPTNPTWVGDLHNDATNFLKDVSAGGIYVSGRYAYIASNSGDSFSIVDISNPRNMQKVSMIIDDNLGGEASALDKAKKVFIAGKYAYVTSIDDSGFSVFDVSNPLEIKELGYLQDDSMGGSAECLEQPQGVFVQGKYAYVTAQKDNALSVIDIAGIDTPSINTGNIQSNTISITEMAQIAGDLFVRSSLNIGGKTWFGDAVSIFGNLKVIGNVTSSDKFINSGNEGISGNFTNGNCWTSYSGGIIYDTNCTSA